ncbi:MAG: NUDIX hydrolase [Planctomycetes bacterium]|nr:NUDIX hydrolase [Planctomycetota bacterium]
MFTIEHRVRVFVFRFDGPAVRYLLVRHRPRAEWPMGPVVGAVALGDHLEDAILREVREETGIRQAHELIELSEPIKDLYGDTGLVEWPFAFQAGTPEGPGPEVRPGPRISDFAWLDFEAAFQRVEARRDRDALVRLRLRIAG